MNEINDLDDIIAIIGLSGRFPQAKDIDSFWQNLKDGVESISVFSEQELLDSGINSNLVKNPNYVRAGTVLSDIEMFDANFFGFSAKEAENLDPQQRLFLESAWEVIESAGYDPEKYRGAIGVYAGISLNTYLFNNIYPTFDSENFVGGYQLMINNDKDFLPTRVSYKLNLRGPAVNVQTACSTSLVAVHLACQSLLNGECNMALAGGVSISVPQKTGYLYTEGMILSPDGHCRAFDAEAKGTVGGSGLGIVMLKRLEDAIADRDSIHAIIRGSAINNDGSLKVGYTAPSIEGQAAVITQAQALAEVDAESITYIEAHGTGTTLGDPIEIAALTKAFRKSTQKQGFCAIGSLKTNMGHLDAAAGVGGLIKTVLALKHKLIPPSLHFEEASPQIDFANSPFYVNTTLSEWKSNGSPRRAGVSSFGIGGTNAHVILEETPLLEPSGESRSKHLLLICAKTTSALEQATTNLAKYFTENSDLNLADVAYTLSCGRRNFNYRRMLVCHSATEALQELTNLDSQQVFTNNISESTDRPVVFMFPGQGSQYVNMALEIYETESVFREQVDFCSEILKPELGLDLRHILYPQTEAIQTAQEKLQQTAIAQVALFVVEYSLAKLWQSWGISPTAAIGHSIGEYVAATLAEVFSLETALLLVAARGKMMQQLPTGGMLSIPLSQEQLQPLLTEKLAIAAINEPSRCVVSGDTESIEILENELAAKNIECRRLHTSHAFHSPMMEPILNDFRDRVKQESLKPPQIPYISNLTGDWITESQATDSNYWVEHLRSSVLFAKGMENLLKNPEQILLEVGPGRTLTSLAKRHPAIDGQKLVLTSVRHPKEDKSDVAFLLTSLGHLWLAGVEVNWSEFYSQEYRYRIPLPTYPFERERYWIYPPKPEEKAKLKQQQATGKQSDISQWFYIPSWKRLPLPPTQLEKSLGNILLFADECGLGEKLGTRLTELGQKVICVKVGDSFGNQGEGVYTLNPTQPDDYNTLLDELVSLNLIPEKVIHLWSLTTEKLTKELDVDFFDKAQDLGFYSLLFLAQALGKQVLANQCEILVISNNMQDVTENEILQCEKATILGPVKVISQEYFNFSCRCIDVTLPHVGSNQEKILIEHLIAELIGKSSAQIIAYRGKSRWVESFELFPLKPQTEHRKQRLKEQGVYLITGGLGGIGIVLAEFLAKTIQAKLILIGRSAFPDRDSWSKWVSSHNEQDSISQKIQKVKEFETYGAEVLVLSADVSDSEQMELVIQKAEKKFGKINGVIHAAGVVKGNSINAIQNIGKAECKQQFLSKIYGTLVLGKLLKNREIDFCLLMSSLSSILGGLGYVAYAASNSFMDYFVRADNHLENNFPWISVNWDGWKINSESKQNSSFGKNLAELLITPSEGEKAFELILSGSNTNQLVVSTGDLEARIDQWVKRERVKKESSLQPLVDSQQNNYRNLGTIYVTPRNQQEEILVDIFKSVLGGTKVGINDDFFELGGDSLIATMLIAKIKESFTIEINISDIFNLTTVAKFSEYINSQKQSAKLDPKIGELPATNSGLSLTPIQPVSRELNLPLSFNQQRMWFIDQLEKNTAAYNISLPARLSGHLDLEVLQQAFTEIICRHEVLRTSFQMVDGEAVQIISDEANFNLSVIDWREVAETNHEQQIQEFVISEVQRSFDLSKNPLLRVTLLQLTDTEYVLIFVIHHIISDDWSLSVIIRELATLYDALKRGKRSPLSELSIQYADFAHWQQQYLQSELFAKQLKYWQQQLAGVPTLLALPTDRLRSKVQNFQGATTMFELPSKLSDNIKQVSLSEKITLFMMLLTGFQTLLYCYSQQQDFCIGSPIANRNSRETEGIIGFFVNTLVLRADISGNPSFRELLQRVREVAIGAFANQDLPFEKLLEELNVERYLSHNPLFQVWFVLHNVPMPKLEMGGCKLEPLRFDSGLVRHDLRLGFWETEVGLTGSFEYRTDLFDAETINLMVKDLENIFSHLVANLDMRLSEMLDIINESKKQQQIMEEQKLENKNQQKLKKMKRKSVR